MNDLISVSSPIHSSRRFDEKSNKAKDFFSSVLRLHLKASTCCELQTSEDSSSTSMTQKVMECIQRIVERGFIEKLKNEVEETKGVDETLLLRQFGVHFEVS